MMLDDVRPARPGAAALSMLASCALVFAACEAPPPTAVSSEPASEASEAGDGPEARGVVRKMDPSAAAAREAAAVVGELARQAGVARYFVDGEAVDDLRSAIDSRPIDRIEVRRPVPDDPEGAKAIYVYTEPAAAEGAADEGSAPGKGGAFRLREARPSGASDQTGSTIRIRGLPSGGPGADASGPAPIIYVDGVRIDGGDANAVPRDRIDRVEIVKGGAAAELYGPEAAGGVILITTKPEAGPRG